MIVVSTYNNLEQQKYLNKTEKSFFFLITKLFKKDYLLNSLFDFYKNEYSSYVSGL